MRIEVEADLDAFLTSMESVRGPWPMLFRVMHLRMLEAVEASRRGRLGSGRRVEVSICISELSRLWGVSRRAVGKLVQDEARWRPKNRSLEGPTQVPPGSHPAPVTDGASEQVGPTQVPPKFPTRGHGHDQVINDHSKVERGGVGGETPQGSTRPPDVAPADAGPPAGLRSAGGRRLWHWLVEAVEPRMVGLGLDWSRERDARWFGQQFSRYVVKDRLLDRDRWVDAIEDLLSKLEAGTDSCRRWKAKLHRYWKTAGGVSKADDRRATEAGRAFDRLAALVCSGQPLPTLDEATRAAWVAAGGQRRAQRERRDLRFMRREFVKTMTDTDR